MQPWELRLLELTTALRTWLLEQLRDEDLAFELPGNPPLGDVLVELARTERAYADSFVTRRLDWSPRDDEPAGAARSVSLLAEWFSTMDAELVAAVQAIDEDDFRTGRVDRGGGFSMPISAQFQTYREAILLAMAKADVYLRALGRPRGEQWEDWLG